jgi:large subunit ribosomal protein L17
MAVIELVEELQVAAPAPAKKTAARKATARQDKVEALAGEDETPASSTGPGGDDAEADQDAEPPESASGDKVAEGPGTQAEGDDTDTKG